MARRPRVLYEGAIYHVTFRGNARQDIFLNTSDRRKLLQRIEHGCEIHGVRLYLYCLMPNHVHLLVETPRANLDRFMGSLLTGYTVYFNRKHQRSGHVMQGRYGAQLVSGDEYLLKLSRYIHLNPVKTDYWKEHEIDDQISFLRQYAWSSYRAYLGLKAVDSWLSTSPILHTIPQSYGEDQHDAYRRFVEVGLSKSDLDFQKLLKSSHLALGSEHFIKEIRVRYLRDISTRIKREDSIRNTEVRLALPSQIRESANSLPEFNKVALHQRVKGRMERCLYAMALQRYAGMTQREIAEIFGINTGAAVSVMMKKYGNEPQIVGWLNQLDLIFKG